MTVRVMLHDLTSSEKKKINSTLKHIPKDKNKRGRIIEGKPFYTMKENSERGFLSIPLYWGINNGYKSNKGKSSKMIFTGKLRDYQVEPVQECLDQLDKYDTTFIDLGTGYGKTIIGAYSACHVGGVTVVLLAGKNLISQWVKSFTDNTTASVYVYDNKTKYNSEDVIIMMRKRIIDMPSNLSTIVRYMIVDEVDVFLCTEGLNAILSFCPQKLMFQSATPKKNNGLHSIYKDFVGEHSVWRKRLKPFTLVIYRTGIIIEREYNESGDVEWDKVNKFLAYNNRRNKKVARYAIENHRGCTLFLSRLKDQAEILAEYCNRKAPTDRIIGNKKTIVKAEYYSGTLSKAGRGLDISSQVGEDYHVDHVIFVVTVADEALFEQCAGRAMRCKRPRVTVFADEDPAIERHVRVAVKISKSNSCKRIIEVDGSES